MRSFRDELLNLGATVHYNSIEEKEFKEDYISKLARLAKIKNYNELVFLR